MAISWYDGNGRLLFDFVVGYICVITPSNQEWFFWKPNIRTFLSCNFSFWILILPAWFAKRGSVFTKQMVFTVQWESCSDYGAIEGPYYYPLSTFFDAAKPKYPWSLSSDETCEKTREGVPCASGLCVCVSEWVGDLTVCFGERLGAVFSISLPLPYLIQKRHLLYK